MEDRGCSLHGVLSGYNTGSLAVGKVFGKSHAPSYTLKTSYADFEIKKKQKQKQNTHGSYYKMVFFYPTLSLFFFQWKYKVAAPIVPSLPPSLLYFYCPIPPSIVTVLLLSHPSLVTVYSIVPSLPPS